MKWFWLALATATGLLVFGTTLDTALIRYFGVDGAALVTSEAATSAMINHHVVSRREVGLRTVAGQAVSSHFETDDSNVMSVDGHTYQPQPGDVFTARYLPGLPPGFRDPG